MSLTVLVTRPAAQAGGWVQRLRTGGYHAVALPLIGIAAAADPAAVLAAWAALPDCRLAVFVSPNAAEQFFAVGPPGAAWPPGTLGACTGPGTAQVLAECGVPPTQLIAPPADALQFDSEALWAVLAPRIAWQGARVLIVRGDGGRDWLADALRAQGAVVTPLAAYRRIAPHFTPAEQALLDSAITRPREFVWLFSSSEAIASLVAAAPGASWARSLAVATHPRIAASAHEAGFGQVSAVRPDPQAVLACLQSLPPTFAP